MPDYSKGKIYAIRAPGTDDVYIGSTTLALSQRMSGHRADLMKGKGCTSQSLICMPGAYIELIEDYPCERKEQLNRREGEIIRSTPNAVNRDVAGRTKAEYYVDNKELILQRKKQHYQQHMDRMRSEAKARRAAKKQSTNIPAPNVECDTQKL